MNVAEFEGQLPRFEEDPALLGAVAASRAALHPDEPEWTDLRIVRQATVVVDKVPTGEVIETVLAEWSCSSGQASVSTPTRVGAPCDRQATRRALRRQPLVVHPVPRARIAAFRVLVYAFLPLDVLLLRPWGAAHGHVDPDLYRPLMIGRILPLPTPTPTLVHRASSTGARRRGGRARRPRSCATCAHGCRPGSASALFLLYLEWMVISFSYGKVDHDRFALPAGPGRAAHRRARRAAGHDAVAGGWVGAAHGSGRRGGDLLPRRGRQGAVRRVGLGQLHHRSRGRSSVAAPMLADPLLQLPWTLQLTQWFILTLEFVSPPCCSSGRGSSSTLVAFLLGFHVMTFLMIRIIFMPHVVCLAAFLPLERVAQPDALSSRIPRPRRPERVAGVVQRLRHHLGLGDHRHEVGVAAPARDHVLVQVRGDPGTSHRPLVHAEVEAVRCERRRAVPGRSAGSGRPPRDASAAVRST